MGEIFRLGSPETFSERNSEHEKTRELDERELWLRGIDAPNVQSCWISKAFELVSSGGTLVQTFGKLLLNLDKVRHFIFLNDKLAFDSKWDKAIFRGVASQQHRKRFMAAFFGNPLVDCGDTGKGSDRPKEWHAPLIALYDHLKYKFVISLEGNDVASNLKWVMSSNSIAIMPRPKFESWFMEGRLQGGVHYIEIKDDYSDLEEKIRYYSTHPEEAKAIIRNAHAFVDQFRDKEREELISLLVLEKYFRHTRQN